MSKLILITGPSGVGKGTIEKELFDDEELNLSFSVSATTRPRREGEIDGVHYHFISRETFKELINGNAFLEYNQHFDNYYGTLLSEVEKKISDEKNVLVEVEINGAINIINKLKKDGKENILVSIFIMPPSMEELENRIRKRNTDTEEQIKSRLARAQEEMECNRYFQYIIKNDNINIAIDKIKTIIKNAK